MTRSSDGKSTCGKSGGGSGKGVSVSTSNKKECTSCEQKNDDDGSSNNTSGGSCNSDIGAVAEGISRVDLSSGDNTGGSSNADINGIIHGVESLARNCLPTLHPKKIAQFVCCQCRMLVEVFAELEQHINLAVGNCYVKGVFWRRYLR